VIEISSSREHKSAVSEPSSDSAVDQERNWDNGVAAERNGQESSGVVAGRFYGVHAGARESSCVVTFVVEGMEMLVEEFADIGDAFDSPRVHEPMYGVEVRLTDVAQEEGPENTFNRGSHERGVVVESANSPIVAQNYFNHSSRACGGGCPEGVVLQLSESRVVLDDLVRLEGRRKRRVIQDPVPEATDEPSADQVAE